MLPAQVGQHVWGGYIGQPNWISLVWDALRVTKLCEADSFVWEVERECIVVRRGDLLIVRRKMLNAVTYAFVLSVVVVRAGDVLSELLHSLKVHALVVRRAKLRRAVELDVAHADHVLDDGVRNIGLATDHGD